MKHTIKNDSLKISVDDFGAVLSSIKSVNSRFEFLWQGNPEIWNGQSPILFPIIGRLLDDKCVIDDNEYSIIRHGIARHRSFDLLKQTDNEIIFIQKEDEQTLESYPYKYELLISFKISDNSLTVTHTVNNTNDKKLFFSIGAHPAFNCEIGDKVIFEKNETLFTERIDKDSIITGEKEQILNNSSTIEINKNIFDKDALIFSDVKSSFVTLKSNSTKRNIKFVFGNSPYFAVWAKPNAPYVCLEPWYGINDSYERKPSFSEKRGIQDLKPKCSFSFSWSAFFNE